MELVTLLTPKHTSCQLGSLTEWVSSPSYDSPAKAEARSLVARMAGRRETNDLKPIDNAIIRMAASQRAVAQANA